MWGANVPRPRGTGKRPLGEFRRTEEDDRVAVVAAGAGARGAYEAGALSVILPALEELGQRPRIFAGTSAGSINATLFASLAHLPASSDASAGFAGNMKKTQVVPQLCPARWRRCRSTPPDCPALGMA